ncbi:CBN-CHT-1 protein [Aphelenchoides avenae]|nr:CBN-CHT-1 protein [Aphelenchus avenae]
MAGLRACLLGLVMVGYAVAAYIRPCYVTNWARSRPGKGAFQASNYIPGLCTHIFHAFVFVGEDWTLQPEWGSEVAEYAKYKALKNTDAELKAVFSIGGGSFPAARFSQMAANTTSRSTFVKSAIAFTKQYGYDGVDVDWEIPQGDADKANHATLIRELKQVGGASFLVTAAVQAGLWAIPKAYNIPELAKYLDFVNVMTYDFHGSWDTATGHNAPLFGAAADGGNANTGMQYWANNGMPKSKLILGIPTYGSGWKLKSKTANQGINAAVDGLSDRLPFTNKNGTGAYFELCEQAKSGSGYRRHWDSTSQVPWLENGDQWYTYDDVESVTAKVNYVKSNGFGGAFVWTLDQDDFNGICSSGGGVRYPLIRIIANQLGGKNIG